MGLTAIGMAIGYGLMVILLFADVPIVVPLVLSIIPTAFTFLGILHYRAYRRRNLRFDQ
jgi:tellurite resistance protein TehA-like permease